MKLKLGDLLTNIRSLTNEIKMSNISCRSGEIVSGATGREFTK